MIEFLGQKVERQYKPDMMQKEVNCEHWPVVMPMQKSTRAQVKQKRKQQIMTISHSQFE